MRDSERAETAPGSETRRVVYCLVPPDLAPKLHDLLRRHFRDDPGVEVIVERRGLERRSGDERRAKRAGKAPRQERRRIAGAAGRRLGERRAALVPVAPRDLPRRAQRHAERIAFVERLEPSTQEAEDRDTARLVSRFQAGDNEAFATLYQRYFDRAYGYLRVLLRDKHEAEDAAQQVFLQAFEALPRYEQRAQPFRSWLFTIVRNRALMTLRKLGRLEARDPAEIAAARDRDAAAPDPAELAAVEWITDRDLLMFFERLPLPQRQVLLLRHMLDLSFNQIAGVLDRSPEDVRITNHRALRFLEQRLRAIGRGPEQGKPIRMRECTKQAVVLRSRRYALS